MENKYQIFGSKSSQDVDVMVFVDSIPSIEESHKLTKEFNEILGTLLSTNKKLNSNLAVLTDGKISHVFKGTSDEVNNSCFLTYHLHSQNHPLQIIELVERDINLKVARAIRIILSQLSRSKYRDIIKPALRGTIKEQFHALNNISFSDSIDFGSKNGPSEDIYKTIAFQLAQVMGLTETIIKELYTKEDIANEYPIIKPFIMREDIGYSDRLNLDAFSKTLLCYNLLPLMDTIGHLTETTLNE